MYYQPSTAEVLFALAAGMMFFVAIVCAAGWFGEYKKNHAMSLRAMKLLLDSFAGSDGENFLAAMKRRSGSRIDCTHDWDALAAMARFLWDVSEPYHEVLGTVKRILARHLPEFATNPADQTT